MREEVIMINEGKEGKTSINSYASFISSKKVQRTMCHN